MYDWHIDYAYSHSPLTPLFSYHWTRLLSNDHPSVFKQPSRAPRMASIDHCVFISLSLLCLACIFVVLSSRHLRSWSPLSTTCFSSRRSSLLLSPCPTNILYYPSTWTTYTLAAANKATSFSEAYRSSFKFLGFLDKSA
jgi:hypothetical protein